MYQRRKQTTKELADDLKKKIYCDWKDGKISVTTFGYIYSGLQLIN